MGHTFTLRVLLQVLLHDLKFEPRRFPTCATEAFGVTQHPTIFIFLCSWHPGWMQIDLVSLGVQNEFTKVTNQHFWPNGQSGEQVFYRTFSPTMSR